LENSRALFRDAVAQFVDAKLTFHELDAYETQLIQLIDTWPAGTDTRKVEA
jgi:hypothetical protein